MSTFLQPNGYILSLIFDKDTTLKGYFYRQLRDHVECLVPSLSVSRALALAIIPSGQGSRWKKGERKPTNAEIEALLSTKCLSLESDDLFAWKIIEEYEISHIKRAAVIVAKF